MGKRKVVEEDSAFLFFLSSCEFVVSGFPAHRDWRQEITRRFFSVHSMYSVYSVVKGFKTITTEYAEYTEQKPNKNLIIFK